MAAWLHPDGRSPAMLTQAPAWLPPDRPPRPTWWGGFAFGSTAVGSEHERNGASESVF